MATAEPPSTPVELSAEVVRYLEHVRVEKRLAARTHTLYTLDLARLTDMAAAAGVPLLQLQSAHIRRFVAQMHGAGRSSRGIALILSGWRGFFTWAGRQGLVASNPVQGVRGPKAAKPLPKALGVDDAVRLADFHATGADPWLEARDAAMVELLYGCGLRVGELVGLDHSAGRDAARDGRGWIDMESGEVHVLGKGGKRRNLPLGAAAGKALSAWLALRGTVGGPALFTGQRGTRLSAQSVWKRLRQRSGIAGLATPVHPHMLRHS
ncbi:MAG: site-specific integrase, partial [Giesbergeria sp.]